MKYLCIKSLTQQNILIKEAQDRQKQDLIKKGKSSGKMSPHVESEKDCNYKINQLKFDLSRGNDKLDLIMQAIS